MTWLDPVRLVVGLVGGAVLLWRIYEVDHVERTGVTFGKAPRYGPLIAGWGLPFYLVMLLVIAGPVVGPVKITSLMIGMTFALFLEISVFYLFLILLMPLLRKKISARCCAALWLMPNLLYIIWNAGISADRPRLVLFVEGDWIGWALLVWAIGFVGVLGHGVVSHLRFRRQVLQPSRPVTDEAILELWAREQLDANFAKVPYRLVISPAVTTPVTIGFFRRSIRVVLPERHYAPEDLRLILRHELIHISREDAGNKFFLRFCCAFCWFNPLMWVAMSRCAQDLELSCDETVLLESDDATRRRYADLLLTTAGDARGFTSCLSASAESLRYRLKNVVQPRKRFLGAVITAGILFLLMNTCGYTAIAYARQPGSEVLFADQGIDAYELDRITYFPEGGYLDVDYGSCSDPDALLAYLAQLPLYRLTGNYDFSGGDQLQLYYNTPAGSECIRLEPNRIRKIPLHGPEDTQYAYYVADLDWEYVMSLFVPGPQELPPPELTLGFYEASGLSICAAQPTLVYYKQLQNDTLVSAAGTTDESESFTLESQDAATANFLLSHAILPGTAIQVSVTGLDSPDVATHYFEDSHFTLVLAPYSARYTLHANLTDGTYTWEVEYRFDVVRPG